jgi:predicted HTH domain antitoxin
MTEATRQLNIRIPESLVMELEHIAADEQLDRTSVARKLLTEGIHRWRLEHALRMYEAGRITKERAAEMANVSIYDILDELRQRGTVARYSLEELREDLALLKQQYHSR